MGLGKNTAEYSTGFYFWVMLTSDLRILVNNSVKIFFYGKRKKKLMFWQFFSFSIKVMSKLFYNRLLTNTLRALLNISLYFILFCFCFCFCFYFIFSSLIK